MKIVFGRFEINGRLSELLAANTFFRALCPRLCLVPVRVSHTAGEARSVRHTRHFLSLLFLPALLLAAPRAAMAQSAGDFRSVASGNWNNTNTWQVYNGAAWVGTNTVPGSSNGVITIQTGNIVTVSAPVTADEVIVQTGGQITVSNSQTLTIANGTGTDLDVSGTIDVLGTLTINSGATVVVENGGVFENSGTVNTTGTLTFNSGGAYQHLFTTTAGTVPTATWNSNSTCSILGYTSNTGTPGGLNQNFGNFVWNCPSQTGTIVMNSSSVTQTIAGSVTFVSTGTGSVVGVSGSDSMSLTVEGNLNMQGGSFNFSSSSSGFGETFTLNLAGSYDQSGGTFTHTSSRADLSFNFSGTSQTFTQSAGTLTTSAINFTVESGSTLTLNNNLAVANFLQFTVNSGATLNCGTSALTGSGSFTLNSGGSLDIGSAAGITSSGAAGNIQVTGTRSYSTGGNYVYDSTAAQVTGNGLPSTVNNLTISNAAGVTLTGGVTVNGTLGLSNGIVATGANTLIISTTGSIAGAGSSTYVNGSLEHGFNTGNSQSYTFPIGDATYYLPLSLSSLNVTHSGNITAKTVAAEDPAIASAFVDTNDSVVRYWTITNGSSLAATYSATFNYSASDVKAAATPAQFIVQNYNGSAWSSATLNGTPSSTSTAITGETAFGDFAIGDTKSPQTITFPAIGNQTYGVSPISLGATASSGLTVTYTTSGPATVSGSTLTITGAGSVTVNAIQSGTADIFAATNSQTITVAKLPITGSVTFNNKGYDGTTSATIATRTLTGVINGDNVALSGGTGAFLSKNAGTNVTAVATGLTLINSTAGDYTLTSTSATNTANITARALTVTAAPVTKGYDGTTNSATNPTITSGTLATGDTSGFTQGFINRNVGTNKTVIPAGAVNDGNSGGNYTVTFVNGNVGKIASRAVTVTAATNSKVYDGTTASTVIPTITSGTIATGDTAGFVETFNNRNVGTGKTLTPSGSVNDGNNGANYSITFATVATGTISTLPITVTGAAASKSYDGTTLSTVVPTITGTLGAGDAAAFTESYDTKDAGTGKTVTPAGSVSDGNSGANYSITFVPAAVGTITANALTVSATGINRIYDGTTNASVVLTDNALAGDNITVTGSASFGDPYVGTNKTVTVTNLAVSGGNSNDYTLSISAVTTTANITPATLTVTADNQTSIYGSALPTLTGELTGVVNGDAITAGYSTTGTSGSPVGGYPITPSLNDPNSALTNYSVTTTPGTLTITAAPLTLTANNATQVYGAAQPAFTGTVSGLVNGDNITASYATTATPTSGVGNYSIVPSPIDPANALGNYTLTTVNGTLSITPASLVGTVVSQSRPYGTTNSPFAVNYAGFVGTDDPGVVSGPIVYVCQDTNLVNVDTNSPVGSYPIQVAVGQTAANYSIGYVSGTLSVIPAPLLVSAQNQSRAYGMTNPAPVATYSGLVNSQDSSVLGGSPEMDESAVTNSPVGVYPITVSQGTLSNANYAMTFSNATLTVTAEALTVTADNLSKTYGAANPTLTGEMTGLQPQDGISVSYSTTATTSSPVGGYAITPSLNDPNLALSNYTVTITPGTLTVNPAPLTVTADNQTSVYGSALPTLTGELTGVVNGDAITAGYSTTGTSGSPVGGYPITPSLNDPNSALTNYSVTTTPGTLTITAAPLTLTANNATQVYGAAQPAFTGTVSGLVNGDNITASYATTATPTNGVGNYSIVPSPIDPANALGNYTLTTVNGTLSITPASLVGTVVSQSRPYGTTNSPFAVNYAGFVGTDDPGVVSGPIVYVCQDTNLVNVDTNSPVGSYPIQVAVGQTAANYSIGYVSGTLSVIPAPLLVSAQNQSRAYGMTNPAPVATYSGLVNSQDSSVLGGSPEMDESAVTNSPVGVYPITVSQGTLSNANYAMTFSNATLTVTAEALTVTADNLSKTYGAANPTLTGEMTGLQPQDGISVSYSTTATTSSPVGGYAITPSLNDPNLALSNYTVTITPGTLTVNPAPLTVTADNQTSVYGSALPTLTGELTGVVNGDAITAGYSTTGTSGSPVGGYPITPSLNDPNSALTNYSVTTTPGTLTITAAPLTLTANNATQVYGAAQPAFTGSVSGLVNGDNITASYATTATPTSGVGNYAIVPSPIDPANALGNYTLTTVNGTLSITPAPSSITWTNPVDIVYGQALGDLQLDAVASVPGVLTYDPPAGTVLNVSNAQVLSVTLAPTDTNYSASATSVLINVLPANSAAAIASSTNPALPGTTVTFTATVSAVAPGAGTPTGVLQFNVDGLAVGTPAALTNGVATFATSSLSHGAHSISVGYAGDTNFNGTTNAMSAQQIINTPPIAPPYTVTALENTAYMVSTAWLMQQVSDPDGDAVTLTAVTATDTNGGTVSINGTNVIYEPAFGSTNTGSFTYTVTDTYGAKATGLVTVLVVAPPQGSSPTAPISMLPNGAVAVTLTAVAGEEYTVQGSDDLLNWTDIGDVVAGPDGCVRIADSDAANHPHRFYRLKINNPGN